MWHPHFSWQASKGASTTLRTVVASIPEIGAVGLYRGIIPATVGSAASHGVRTGVFELTFRLIKAVSGGALELQVGSGAGLTWLGRAGMCWRGKNRLST
jgi:predicted lysophospholipase L1 biosynthesis ABC-type transport system permease subunit